MSTATADELARAASSGDGPALEKIYRDYHQPLYRFCLAIVGNPQDAQDALQNTMVKMLRSLPGEERRIALKPWLYRVAHNESIDLLRKRRPSVPLEAGEPQLGEELSVQIETRQRLRQLIADLSALPERQRETLLMREAAGLSFEEIGGALETSPAVARQTLYEARLGLRQMDAGREMTCEAVTKALSDGDGRIRRRRDIRAHLRDCADCRRFAEEIDSRRDALAAISPLPAVAAAAMLQGLLGGGTAGGAAAGAGAGGGAGLAGGAAVKTVGTATLLKGAATVAVVAAIGAGAADRAGLIHVGGGSGSPAPAAAGTAGAGAGTADAGAGTAATGGGAKSGAQAGAHSQASPRTSVGKSAAAGRGAADQAVHPAPSVPPTTSAGAPASGEPASADPGSAAAGAAPSEGSSTTGHPHGRNHPKQTPAAAAHGQETAASHKPEKAPSSGGSGPSAGKGQGAEHAAEPAAAATPATPATEPAAKSPPEKPSK